MRTAGLLVMVLGLAACSPQQAATSHVAPAATPQQAEAPAPPAVPAADGGPPLVDGLYHDVGACPGEGCNLSGKIRARAATDLYDRAGKGAVVSGQVAAGEWVEIAGTEAIMVPLRGVVREARGSHAVGDVIYLLTSQGEGCFDAWSKGALISWCDPEAGMDADSPPLDLPAPPAQPVYPDGVGFWVNVKREQGGGGWVKDVYGSFDCSNPHDSSADCPVPQ